MPYVQAFVTATSFPVTLEELARRDETDMEAIFEIAGTDGTVGWTSPKWAKKGDVAFFYHTKSALPRIRRLKAELAAEKAAGARSEKEIERLGRRLEKAEETWRERGGAIFAVGRVVGRPFADGGDGRETKHWGSNIYAEIGDVFLVAPTRLEEFGRVVPLARQSTITPVFGTDFDFLKKAVMEKTEDVEPYFAQASAQAAPLASMTGKEWLDAARVHRRNFILEAQFRKYFCDCLLSFASDGAKPYEECACVREGRPTAWVDYAIAARGKYLPVEVKLNAGAERDLAAQLDKYLLPDEIWLTKKGGKKVSRKDVAPRVLVIDTEAMYAYDGKELRKAYDLDDLADMENLAEARNVIRRMAEA